MDNDNCIYLKETDIYEHQFTMPMRLFPSINLLT